jgi:menaquinone-dependent protoporphyrinogen oxidase
MVDRVLVAHGTSEGQAARVAQEIASQLRQRECDTYVADLEVERPDLGDFDGVVVGGSVHAGKYQHEVREFAREHATQLQAMPSWFFGVSLSEAGGKPGLDHAHAEEQIEALFSESGWRPRAYLSVAGALKYRDYNFVKRGLMKHIVEGAGGDTDTSRNYEYTDWQKVDAFAGEIAAALSAGRVPELSAP